MNPIVVAVEPLRIEAIKHAKMTALTFLDGFNTMLINENWNVDAIAPYPQGKIDLVDYNKTLGSFILSRKLLKLKDAPVSEMREFVFAFIKDAEDNAEHQYNIFINQLQAKIGDYTAIEFKGNHVVSQSILKVIKSEEKTIHWKSEMVPYLSKNGKHVCDFVIKKMKSKELVDF